MDNELCITAIYLLFTDNIFTNLSLTKSETTIIPSAHIKDTFATY